MNRRKWTSAELIQFETEIAETFNAGGIRAPIHLSDGSEESLLAVFGDVHEGDWVFCSWRSHYQALLHGVPQEEVRQEILNGRSIALCFPKYRLFSSGIVGGNVPIAVGVALGIKRGNGDEHVWCFVGDMTSEIGITQSAIKYSLFNALPITFVVENNGVSVCTDTLATWGLDELTHSKEEWANVSYFEYRSNYPHAGAGKRVEF